MHNTQPQSIKVLVRLRPLSKKQQEAVHNYQTFWQCRKKQNNKAKLSQAALSFFTKYHNVKPTQAIQLNNNCVSVCDQEYKSVVNKFRNYVFSGVYGSEVSNESIFYQSIKDEMKGVLQGINCTILAYGITGSGKTFSVFGHPKLQKDKGLCHLAFEYLFNKKKQQQTNSTTRVEFKFSFIQIYNQNVRDLLSEDTKKHINIGQDSKGNLTIVDVNQVHVKSIEQMTQLVSMGTAKRTSAATQSNQLSSRSHAVLKLNVQVCRQGRRMSSKLFVIDLAGSQKINTDNCMRKQQGSNINKSLLSLGNCINALIDNNKKNGSNHIPYRDSKLTRLLKDSLGGTARTIMIACISSNPFTLDQTITTLNYAQRAQGIKKEIVKNEQSMGAQCPRCRQYLLSKKQHQIAHNKVYMIESRNSKVLKTEHNQTGGIYLDIFQRLYNDIIQNVKQGQQINRLRAIFSQPEEEFDLIMTDNQQQKIHLKQMLMDMLRQKVKMNIIPQAIKLNSTRKKIRLSHSARKHSKNINLQKSNQKQNIPVDTVLLTQTKNNHNAQSKNQQNSNVKSFDSHVKLFEQKEHENDTKPLDQRQSSQSNVVHRRRRSKFEIVPRPPQSSARKLSEQKTLTQRNGNQMD